MLKIRPSQLVALQQSAEAGFLVWLSKFITNEYGEAMVRLPEGSFIVAQLPIENTMAMIRNGVGRAGRFGVDEDSAQAAFVVLMFLMAPNFDEHPVIRRALTDDDVPSNKRVEQIFQHTTDQVWETIVANYDPYAWSSGPVRE